MNLFKSKYSAKSTQIQKQNAIGSGKLEVNDREFLSQISIMQKSRIFLQIGRGMAGKPQMLLQWLYLRSSGQEVFIPQEAIADELNISVRTVKRYVKELIRCGYIYVRWFRNPCGMNLTSGMRIAPKAWRELISIFANFTSSLKRKVKHYIDNVKRPNVGSDTMSRSIVIKGGTQLSEMTFPRNTKERTRLEVVKEIPF